MEETKTNFTFRVVQGLPQGMVMPDSLLQSPLKGKGGIQSEVA